MNTARVIIISIGASLLSGAYYLFHREDLYEHTVPAVLALSFIVAIAASKDGIVLQGNDNREKPLHKNF